MKKRKSIRKQLKLLYVKNYEQYSRTERVLFNLLIVSLGKRKRIRLMIFGLKLLKLVISIVCADSRPGSLQFCYAIKPKIKPLYFQRVVPINRGGAFIDNMINLKESLENRRLIMTVHLESGRFWNRSTR